MRRMYMIMSRGRICQTVSRLFQIIKITLTNCFNSSERIVIQIKNHQPKKQLHRYVGKQCGWKVSNRAGNTMQRKQCEAYNFSPSFLHPPYHKLFLQDKVSVVAPSWEHEAHLAHETLHPKHYPRSFQVQ